MSRFLELLKINGKLLLRNKGFLFFLLITPIVSVIIMNLHVNLSFYEEEQKEREIQELSGDDKVVYLNDWSDYAVKLYDGAGTELSQYVLEKMAGSGMFSIYRTDAGDMTEAEVQKLAEEDAMNDRMGTILYVKPPFDENVMKGNWEEAFLFYEVSEDERWELWEKSFSGELSAIYQAAQALNISEQGTVGTEEQVLSILQGMQENLPEKEIISLEGKDGVTLSAEQSSKRGLAGYAYAIITLGFLFCGVCIAYTVIEERENKVYTRIMLSKVGRYEYLLSKLVMSVLISVLQTGVTAVCMFVAGDTDFGISRPDFLLFIFLLGLIFSILSMGVGILIGDVMGANYAVFAVWSISALLAGLYFPIDTASGAIKAISYLMPQRWFLKGTEMLMGGDKSAYPMIACVSCAYLIVILSVGVVGLKMKESDV